MGPPEGNEFLSDVRPAIVPHKRAGGQAGRETGRLESQAAIVTGVKDGRDEDSNSGRMYEEDRRYGGRHGGGT
jgi:hypothetical protein